MMLKATDFLLIISSLVILACNGDKTVVETPVMSKTQQVLRNENDKGNLQMVPYSHNMHGVSLLMDSHEQIMRNIYQANLFVAGANNSYEKEGVIYLSWREQNARARPFLAQYDQDPYAFFYRQEIAQKMIANTDLLADPSEEAVAALEYYFNLMVNEGMYSPGLYFYALSRLKENWPNSRVSETVRTVVGESEKYTTKNNEVASEYKKMANTDKVSAEMVAYFEEVNRLNQLYSQRLQRL